MAILTVDELREHIESALGEDALQRLLDATEEMIVAYAGAAGAVTELRGGQGRYLTTSRPISSISSITERTDETDEVTLAADDYRLLMATGYVIERRSGGTNSRSTWRPWVEITYTPVDDSDTRKLVQLGLIELKTTITPGITMKQIGSWSEQYNQGRPFDQLIADALSLLRPAPGMVVV